MVDEIIDLQPTKCTTGLTIKSDNLLVEGDCFSEAGLLEHIAQSSAAWQGARQSDNARPQTGVIGSIRNCTINRLPRIGETLQTTIEIIAELGNKQVIHAKTFSAAQQIIEADINIALM